MRPRRSIDWVDSQGYVVSDCGFTSTDQALAVQVRDEMDRVDPLPCPHEGNWAEVRTLGERLPFYVCTDCGERREEQA